MAQRSAYADHTPVRRVRRTGRPDANAAADIRNDATAEQVGGSLRRLRKTLPRWRRSAQPERQGRPCASHDGYRLWRMVRIATAERSRPVANASIQFGPPPRPAPSVSAHRPSVRTRLGSPRAARAAAKRCEKDPTRASFPRGIAARTGHGSTRGPAATGCASLLPQSRRGE